ncbi:MAG: cytochrome ubiquinol oxidase subunit I [Elusimicrobiales bacterium]|nr:cytochrome ubiquinol oxidase subunit I [Elusimicrobiales bacterium]
MDALLLSRLQFGVTAGFHFLFVPLTIGLALFIAAMETLAYVTKDERYVEMAKFWGNIFLINFVVGVVTGITLEFQFGMNWAAYSVYVGDVFGAPLAIEAASSFFLESVFIGIWIFGWKRVSRGLHLLSIWMVAIGTNLSALWIILANGWMQNPVGYVVRNGRAEMIDFAALLSNPYGWAMFLHTVLAAWAVAGFFVMGVSAWHLLRKNAPVFFGRSFRFGAFMALAASLGVLGAGDINGMMTAKLQPAKFAAMEAVWETEKGVPYNLLVVPDPANERNRVEALGIPKLLSFMAFKDSDAEIKGLKDFHPDDRPPLWPVFISFKLMVALGMFFIAFSAAAVALSLLGRAERYPLFLKAAVFVLPLPYLACELGWIVTEMGRQPWVVYGLMRTAEGASPNVGAGMVAFSLVSLTLVYAALGALGVYLMFKYAAKVPEGAA